MTTKRPAKPKLTSGICPRCKQRMPLDVLGGMAIHMLPGDGALIECGGVGLDPVDPFGPRYTRDTGPVAYDANGAAQWWDGVEWHPVDR